MDDETVKVMWIALMIVILECFAMYMKINGTALSLAVAALAGLGGYTLKTVIDAFREKG